MKAQLAEQRTQADDDPGVSFLLASRDPSVRFFAVRSRLGMTEDPRVRQLAYSLIEWQWPDGGWNCDRREEARHSSFNESLSTLWGLVEYYHATKDNTVLEAVEKAGEFFLKHRIFKSCRTN